MSNDKVQSIMALVKKHAVAYDRRPKYSEPTEVEAAYAALESAIREAIAAPGVAQDQAHYSEQLTKAKRLIVDVWQRHPEARGLIEARTGRWFVWGDDRDGVSKEKT